MPISGGGAAEKGPGGGGRTTFRPPWVKDGPQPIPMPVAPWTKKNATTNESTAKENGQPTTKDVKLQSREVKVPIMTERKKSITEPIKPAAGKDKDTKKIDVIKEDVDGNHNNGNNKKEKSIPIKIEKSPSKLREPEKSTSNADLPDKSEKSGKFIRPQLKKVAKVEEVKIPKTDEPTKVITPVLKKVPPKEEVKPEKPQIPITRNELKSVANAPPPPPLPPGCGPPPPPPPPPGVIPPPGFEKKPISEKQKAVLEKLKARPRRRPDWSDMMKEVESGRKLKHVQCNDRSNPILTSKSITNIKGQYIYETEKANVHNALLKQIQFGVSLKPTRTNDRSKPILAGLRKFRRQMTIEEQIQKSESRAQLNEVAPVEESEDEMDDIDKLRDDLQSTKQMLALELRNKEAEERENKRLLAKIQILEAELEREKSKDSSGNGSTTTSSTTTSSSAVDETLVKSLKKDAEEAQKTSKLLEKKYQEAAEQLDASKNELEEQKRQIANLEKKLSQAAQGGGVGGGVGNAARRQSEAQQKDSSPEPDLDLSDESESDEDEEKKEERIARRLNREVKMLRTKLVRLKDKEKAAKKERENLREAMKKNQKVLKEEHKKFKKLQKEVDKMAAMMKDGEGTDDDEEKEDDEEEEEEEAEEEETEEDDESETDESEEETESESESEPEDASDEDKKTNYEPRIKRHEGRLAALKKGNYLLQTNVDRLLDEINKMREKSVSLKADLDSVLSELG